MTEPFGMKSLTMTSPPGPSTMNRGRSKPEAYSSTEKPAGTLICAPAGRGTMVGAFEMGGAWASAKAATKFRATSDFIEGRDLHSTARIFKQPCEALVSPADQRMLTVTGLAGMPST